MAVFTKRVTNIDLDIRRSTGQKIRMVEGDTANQFVISLYDNGTALDLTNLHVRVVFRRSDGHVVYQSDTDNNLSYHTTLAAASGKVTVDVSPGSFCDGKNELEVQIMQGSGDIQTTLITSAKLEFMARNCLMTDDATLSSAEYPILNQLIGSLENILTSVTTLAAGSSATASMTYDSTTKKYTLALGIPRGAFVF